MIKCLFKAIAILFVLVCAIVILSSGGEDGNQPGQGVGRGAAPDLAAQQEVLRLLDSHVKEGAVYHYEINEFYLRVRVEPVIWSSMDAPQKQGFLQAMQIHHIAYGGRPDAVTILSSLNDTVFAEYSWGQPKIRH
jgi:hypothetical protein